MKQETDRSFLSLFFQKPKNGKQERFPQKEMLLSQIQLLKQEIRRLQREINIPQVITSRMLDISGVPPVIGGFFQTDRPTSDVHRLMRENTELEIENTFFEAEIADLRKQMKSGIKRRSKGRPKRKFKAWRRSQRHQLGI